MNNIISSIFLKNASGVIIKIKIKKKSKIMIFMVSRSDLTRLDEISIQLEFNLGFFEINLIFFMFNLTFFGKHRGLSTTQHDCDTARSVKRSPQRGLLDHHG